jgi:hypothetical protein
MYPLLCLAAALAMGQAEPEPPPAEAPRAHEAPAQEHAAGPDRGQAGTERRAAHPKATSEKPVPTARPAEAERSQVARAALAFLDAFVAGDAGALSAAASERFSLDGDLKVGKDQIRRAFQEVVSARDPSARPALLDLELLPATDAVARLGPAPPRIASLATARGTWVAIANLSRRPLVLFLAREGNRFAVAGVH